MRVFIEIPAEIFSVKAHAILSFSKLFSFGFDIQKFFRVQILDRLNILAFQSNIDRVQFTIFNDVLQKRNGYEK